LLGVLQNNNALLIIGLTPLQDFFQCSKTAEAGIVFVQGTFPFTRVFLNAANIIQLLVSILSLLPS